MELKLLGMCFIWFLFNNNFICIIRIDKIMKFFKYDYIIFKIIFNLKFDNWNYGLYLKILCFVISIDLYLNGKNGF